MTYLQLYGGVYNLFRSGLPRIGIDITMVDIFDLDNLKKCLRPQTKLVWLEACTNPLVMLADLEATIKAVKEFNADIIVGIDNTFLSPWILVCTFTITPTDLRSFFIPTFIIID